MYGQSFGFILSIIETSSLRNNLIVFINNPDECFAPMAVYDIFCRALANSSHEPNIKDKNCFGKNSFEFPKFFLISMKTCVTIFTN